MEITQTNRFSKPKQFWEWFRRNAQHYRKPQFASKKEALYLLREMTMHLMAYGQTIRVEIYWPNKEGDGEIEVVFTTYGRTRHFRKVEMLVAKAPPLPGWTFFALDPPRPIDFFFEVDFPHLDIDPFKLWFEPPDFSNNRERSWLQVYIDTWTEITQQHVQAARAAAYNVLGEKVYGLRIIDVEVERLCEIPEKQRNHLVNLQNAHQYIHVTEVAGVYVNDKGRIEQRPSQDGSIRDKR
ncbi:MAG: hypothetical protein J7621_21795 [Niastella sp.]|nr:hypothetical protein [Niastella sp.]